MDYQLLSDDEKDKIYQQTVHNLEAEHFSAGLALRRAEATGNVVEIDAWTARLADLEKQHAELVGGKR
jgi:hypothetical protein